VRDRIVRTYMLIKKYRSAIKLCTGAKTKWIAHAEALLPHLSNGGIAREIKGDFRATATAVHVHPLVAQILVDAAFKTRLWAGLQRRQSLRNWHPSPVEEGRRNTRRPLWPPVQRLLRCVYLTQDVFQGSQYRFEHWRPRHTDGCRKRDRLGAAQQRSIGNAEAAAAEAALELTLTRHRHP